MKYSFTSRIRYSEIGEDGCLTLPGLINSLSGLQVPSSRKRSARALRSSKTRLRLGCCPRGRFMCAAIHPSVKRVKITTWASGFKGFLGMRNFTMETEDGEMLACANSIWSYVNMETGHPVRAPKETTDAYGIDGPIDEDFGERKVKMPEADFIGEPFPVRPHNLDTNHHVNNALSSFPLPVNAFRRTSPCAGCAPNTNSRRTSAMSCIRCAPRRKTAVLSR